MVLVSNEFPDLRITPAQFFQIDHFEDGLFASRPSKALSSLINATSFRLSDQAIGKVIGSIQIGNTNRVFVKIKTADGAIVCRKPNVILVDSFLPGNVEDGANQMTEKSAMAENGDAMFGASFHIT